jgi:hypothetical protein
VAGDRGSLEWLICEGESDAARLFGLTEGRCACLVLPCGARTWRPSWGDSIPRGAEILLALDADEDGDAGSSAIAKALGGKTTRLRPPQASRIGASGAATASSSPSSCARRAR